jgi:FKBP-type peptidyl-prolyl cis-trans isomerase
MRRNSAIALVVATSAILVGCDKCSRDKAQTSTTAETASQPAADSQSGLTDQAASAPAPAATETQPDAAATDPNAAGQTATDAATTATQPGAAATAAEPAPVTGSLKITDVKKGSGAEALDGKKVTVHYTGTLENGTKFDSSRDRGSPFPFVLGSGMVIAGWEQGVKGMKVGGIRKLVIPPNLAYGNRSVGGVIPPNSTLLFEIELLKVE